jgi:hypothetical protein
MNAVAAQPHVTLSGDRAGEYVIEEEHSDGRLVLAPEDSSYPLLTPAFSGRPASTEEFQHLLGDLPTDGEG